MRATLVRQAPEGEERPTEGLTARDRKRVALVADEAQPKPQKDAPDPDDTLPYFKRKLEER